MTSLRPSTSQAEGNMALRNLQQYLWCSPPLSMRVHIEKIVKTLQTNSHYLAMLGLTHDISVKKLTVQGLKKQQI